MGSEFAHLSWESLVELVLPGDQGLAQGRLVEAEHTRVPPDLVDKGFQQDALVAGLHVHGPEGWAHPPGAGSREKGGAAGSSGQRVLRLSSVRASVFLASAPRPCGPGRSAESENGVGNSRAPPQRRWQSSSSRKDKTARAPAEARPRRPLGPAPSRRNKQPPTSRAGPDGDWQGLAGNPKQLQSPPPGLRRPPPRSHDEVKSQFQT